jgi:hypothetical protein
MRSPRFRLGRVADGHVGDAWRALQFGLLWGVGTTAMEIMATPVAAVAGDGMAFLGSLISFSCAKSVLVAYFALRAERRCRGWRLGALALLGAIAVSIVSMGWITVVDPDTILYRFRQQPVAVFCYDLWWELFYGGLLFAACLVMSRAARMRNLLSQAEIDRGLTEALVAEIRLKELQGSVNAEVLYEALAEVMRRYVAGLPSADRLLDALVGFLRAAMPSLRETLSTLAAELELTRAYLRLRAELYPQRAAWRVEAADDLGALLFPPLQLIDVLDRWTGSAEGQPGGVMQVTRCAGGARVELRSEPGSHGDAEDAAVPGLPWKTFDFLNPAHLPGAPLFTEREKTT